MNADAPSESQGALQLVGQRLLDRYEIERRLAYGGMSVVYAARDQRLQRPVCVKVFCGIERTQASYQTVYEHFIQEAFALSQLSHPNTVRIYDFGYLEDGSGSPFQVAEYLEGGTLQQRVRNNGPLSTPRALSILEPVAGALEEAHGRGVVHRDIKPSNILFGRAGASEVVKVADFGIAKAYRDSDQGPLPHRAPETNPGNTGPVLCSLAWAAPEQLRRAGGVGPETDVYSLGVLTAFMLAGQPLFSARESMSLLDLRLGGDEVVEGLLAELPIEPDVLEVLRKACRHRAEERYASVEALLEALREATRASGGSGPRPVVDPTDPFAEPLPWVRIDSLETPQWLLGDRPVQLVESTGETVLGSGAGPLDSPTRVRITLLPTSGGQAPVHLKGLNCFVAVAGSRPSSAASLSSDADVELLSVERQPLDAVRVRFGRAEAGERRFFVDGGGVLAIPRSLIARAALLDYGPGRELLLLFERRSP